MSIKPFIRDTAFFQSLRDRNMPIRANDLDDQFNNISDYVNKKIVPIIDILAGKQIPGILGNADMFLKNVGDGTTIFDRIIINNLEDYTIGLNKLSNTDVGSILATGNDNSFARIMPLASNQILSATLGNAPVWKQVSGNNFANNTIQGNKVDFNIITANHLAADVFGQPLANNSISEQHFIDGTIGDARTYGVGAITSAKITQTLTTQRNNAIAQNTINNQGRLVVNVIPARCFVAAQIQERHLVTRDTAMPNEGVLPPFKSASSVLNTLGKWSIHSTKIQSNFATNGITPIVNQNDLKKRFLPGSIETRHIAPFSISINSLLSNMKDQSGNAGILNLSKYKYAFRQKLGI